MAANEWPKAAANKATADAFSTALEDAGPMIRASRSRSASWEVVRRPARLGLSHDCGLTLSIAASASPF
jgi:hypothetical protein